MLVEQLSIPDLLSTRRICSVVMSLASSFCLGMKSFQRRAKLWLEGERDKELTSPSECADSSCH